MEKNELMLEYEKETRETLDMSVLSGDATGSWYGFLDMMNEKAAAYDRLMGGKGCVYCNGPESLISDSHIEVEISDGKIHASEDEFGSGGWVKIEYCPMCGRHLTIPDGWEEK